MEERQYLGQEDRLKAADFQENDIRPTELLKDQNISKLHDIGRLLSRRKEFVSVPCPACKSGDFTKKFEKYGLEYLSCVSCETMYISPRPTAEVLEDCYRDSEVYAYWNKYIYPASEEARRKKLYVPRVDRVLEICHRHHVATDSILEVGSGFGTFCVEMRSRNRFKRIVAIEQTPDLAQTCRQKGIETLEKPIEKIDFKDKFDVVVNFEVIEHLFSPKEFLLHGLKFLKPGGIFVVTCPNGKGFDIGVLGELSKSVDHEHLNYFNPDSLSVLLRSCGFEVLESLTPGRLDAELVRNKILAGEFDVSQKPFLRQVLIEKWESVGRSFQDFLANHNLSSHMWLVARKL